MTSKSSDSYRRRIFETYTSSTYEHRTDLSETGLAKNARGQAKIFGPYLPRDREAAILEIGCGNGGFLRCCRDLGYERLSGLDISPEQVAFCREQGFPQVVCTDGLTFLRGCRDSFGLIVLSDVLEHLPKSDAVELLVEARGRLDDGGKIVIRVPNMSNPLNLRTRYVDFTHELGFTKESLAQVLRAAGFEVESVEGVFQEDRRWLMRLAFDVVLWKLFLLLYHHTLHLTQEVVRGKNLLAVGVKNGGAPDG